MDSAPPGAATTGGATEAAARALAPFYAAAWSSRSRARCTWWAPWRVQLAAGAGAVPGGAELVGNLRP